MICVYSGCVKGDVGVLIGMIGLIIEPSHGNVSGDYL